MPRRRVLYGLIIIVLFTLPALSWAWNTLQTSARGLTERQALDYAEVICRVLAPDAGPLRLTAEPLQMYRAGRPVRFWSVEGLDAAGRNIVTQTWDRDMGDLQKCNRLFEPLPVESRPPALDRAEAVRTAGRALRTLGIAQQGARWRATGAPERTRHGWWVTFQADDRKVFVNVDAFTGAPIAAEVRIDRTSDNEVRPGPG